MKITVLTALPFWHPGTQELIDNIRKHNIEIDALDIFHGKRLTNNNELVNLIPFNFTGLLAKVYMKLFRSYFIKKHTKKADIIDIHFVEPLYSKYIHCFNQKVICSLFGSDLFRTSKKQKTQQKPLLEKANRIVLSENMIPYFEKHFHPSPTKYIFNQYGSNRLDSILELKKTTNGQLAKRQLGLAEDKIIVTCGYNGKKEQQHIKIITAISKLEINDKSKIQLVFPMTYGQELAYIDTLHSLLKKCEIDFKLFTERLRDEDLSYLRIASDITINTQTTDALASSIKEAMVAGDIMLIGKWLPYEIYSNLGVFYSEIDFTNLTEVTHKVLSDLETSKNKSKKNSEIIRKFASWETLIPNWVQTYKDLYNESK